MTDYKLATIEEIIDDASHGRMFILVDDEDRENEGDLVIPAEMADSKAINFMAKHGRGLICLSMTSERVSELGLPPMAKHNGSRHQTAFTVSIEAREGITTGISAADRAHTISVAINQQNGARDIVTPGHIFPLEARDGGVLVRAGHTEAAVDIARMAGLKPAGVICEIMNDDGTMARMPDLVKFAAEHGLKIATIADLIAYRRRKEKLVEKITQTKIKTSFAGEFDLLVYSNIIEYAEHIVLVKGKIDGKKPVYVRMHALNVLNDVLGDMTDGKDNDLRGAMKMINEKGEGVIVILRGPNKSRISDLIKIRNGELVDSMSELREYGIGAQILGDLGVKEMILLSNSQKYIIGLDGYDLKIVGVERISA